MVENSKIEWTDHTFNPWVGCTKVGPGCDHCYAESWGKRSGRVQWGDHDRIRTTVGYWRQPLIWDRNAQKSGVRARVFCASLADVFDNTVPEDWRIDLFELIDRTPSLDWLLLTKRIGNVRSMVPMRAGSMYRNIWLGATVVNQEEANRDVPKLLDVPARIRFLSMEPLLGPVNLSWTDRGDGMLVQRMAPLDWVIVGGESGAGARPMDGAWVYDLRRQCKEGGVAFFMKQGSKANWPDFKDFDNFPPSVRVREFPV
jgi:protein gp37